MGEKAAKHGGKSSKAHLHDEDESMRVIISLKDKEYMRVVEESEDCFILDFDTDDDESVNVSAPPPDDTASGISVVAEKGQVACRDYPHFRHQCVKCPFNKTRHRSYCKMCYCYICDEAAPCTQWSLHCHADDKSEYYRHLRRSGKGSEWDSIYELSDESTEGGDDDDNSDYSPM